MARMSAKRSFRYAGRRLVVGDEFDTRTDRDALLLEAAGRANRTAKVAEKAAKVEAKRRGRPPKTVAAVEPSVAAEPVAPPEAAVYGGVDLASISDEATFTEVPGDGRYNRRDLRADDE